MHRVSSFFERPFQNRAIISLIILSTVAVRLVWALAGPLEPLQSELQRAAVSLSQTGVIANAYRPDSGPTSHVGLLAPLPAAGAYWLFGLGHAAEIFLTVVASLVIGAGAFTLYAVFGELGASRVGRTAALLFICLLPVNIALQAQDLRARETAWAALGLALLILVALRLDRLREHLRLDDALGLSLGSALLFLLSPAVAFAGYGALGILALRRVKARYWLPLMALAAAVTALVSFPWALRNEHQFGRMVWSRGNFGIEFALGTYPGAVSPADPAAAFRSRLKEIHPFQSDRAYAEMEAVGGEVPYSEALAKVTWRWVVQHPGDAIRIWSRHLAEFYFPPAWLWNPYGRENAKSRLQVLVLDLVSALAVAGLLSNLWRRRWRYLYLAMPLVLIALPYMLAQPRLRYRYAVASMLVFMAAEFVQRLCSRLAIILPERRAQSVGSKRSSLRP